MPDRVLFLNDEHGFIVRVSNLTDDHHAQRIVTWGDVASANFPVIEKEVDRAVQILARAQGEDIK